jgi:hypothetical protein
MEMDGVFPRAEIVEFECERHALALIGDDHFADGFALSIFDFTVVLAALFLAALGDGNETISSNPQVIQAKDFMSGLLACAL